MGFFTRLENRACRIDSLLCVGLDPHPADLFGRRGDDIPSQLFDFCRRLIDATEDSALAFKPNIAFFEAHGPEGVSALKKVIDSVPEGIPVILDAKRGDVASTAQAYAQAVFNALGADALTINPLLGYDALEPFLDDLERGVFVLCKTSNPGASDFQGLTLENGDFLYEIVARKAREWNHNDNVGLVVGATQPQALERVRKLAPDIWILAPGVGAQGGGLGEALECGLRSDGLGLLISVSRGISRADDPRQAATDFRNEINRLREEIDLDRGTRIQHFESNHLRSKIADGLLETGCIKFGEFKLKSGLLSPIYIDLRQLVAFPRLLVQIAKVYIPLLNQISFDQLAALPYGALPIATAIGIQGGWSYVYPRKEVKDYGTRATVEGVFKPGERVVIIDDLVTTGGSKFEGIEKLTLAGLEVTDVVVLIDRQSGAREALSQAGYRLHAVYTLTQLLDYWERMRRVPVEKIIAVRRFLDQGIH